MGGSHSIISRGMYELQLRPWLKTFQKEQFLVLKLESMSSSPSLTSKDDAKDSNCQKSELQLVMERVWKHLDLPNFTIEDEKAKNSRTYKSEMSEATKVMLNRFFEPHSRRLATILGEIPTSDAAMWK